MKDIFTTTSAGQTRKLGELMAKELRGGEIICLIGELGSGKTTFAQGALKGLGAAGPHTSPTFIVMKQYRSKDQSRKGGTRTKNVYHVDAYRVHAQDVLNLGWEEIVADKKNIVIVEWAERIKSIIPERAVWLKFEHIDGDQRKISTI